MRWMMYQINGQKGLAVSQSEIFHGLLAGTADYPGDLDDLLARQVDLNSIAPRLLKQPPLDLETVGFLPPLGRPKKIICLGLNYLDHSQEFGHKNLPAFPELFARFSSSLVGHQQALVKPRLSDQLDYECEMAVIIGQPGRHIKAQEAHRHIAAYSAFNDASVRDFQKRGSQWLPGKNFDATGAFGPWLVTADSLPLLGAGLKIESRLNGQVMQKARTSDMIFPVDQQIAYISQILTLEAGDVIVTGTPGGVGLARNPQIFMKAGDVCEVEIEAIGLLRNPIVNEE